MGGALRSTFVDNLRVVRIEVGLHLVAHTCVNIDVGLYMTVCLVSVEKIENVISTEIG